MKTYANFLYLGNLLAQCPDTNPVIYGLYTRLFKPTIKIVEEDCGTKVGQIRPIIPTSNKSVGYIELSNLDTPMTPVRIRTLLANTPLTSFRVRLLPACTSTGGICRKCLWASYEYIDPLFNRNDIVGTVDYPNISTVPTVGQSVSFDFTLAKSTLFLSHLVNGYSGSLLGMKSYLLDGLPLRGSLLREKLPDNIVSFAHREIADTGLVSTSNLAYAEKLEDNLERVLYLLGQYIVGYYTSNLN